MKIFRDIAVGLTLLVIHSAGETMMIDSFSPINHDFDLVMGDLSHRNTSLVAAQSGSVLGGERDVELVQAQDPVGSRDPRIYAGYHTPPNLFEEYYFLGGIGTGLGGNSFESFIILQYDGSGDENGNTGLNKLLNNNGVGSPLFDGSEGGIRLRYGWSDTAYVMWVTLRRLGSIVAETQRIIDIHNEFADEDFVFTQAELSGVDSLSLRFRVLIPRDQKHGLFIESISTIVPEPDPGLALGGAMAAAVLAGGRKRRKN